MVETEHTIPVQACSILNGVQAFLTANARPPAVAAALVYDQLNGGYETLDGDGGDFDARYIYFEHGGKYYSIKKHPELCIDYEYNDSGSQWAVRVSDLQNLVIKEVKYNGVRYNTIVWGSGEVGMTSANFSQSNNPCNWDCSQLPYIGLVNRDARDGKARDRSETYPFSFVRCYYGGGYSNRNAEFCVPLCLFPDNQRIQTSTYLNNNVKPT